MRHCLNKIFGRCSRIDVLRIEIKPVLNSELFDNIVEALGHLEIGKIEADQLKCLSGNNGYA